MVIVRHNVFVSLGNTNRIRSFCAKGDLYVLFFYFIRAGSHVRYTVQQDAVHYGKCAFIASYTVFFTP